MTKSEMVERIQNVRGLSKKDSAEMLEVVFSTIKDTIESGVSLMISGFGTFSVRQKAGRRGRNPQTGDSITIEAKKILSFKPRTLLRARINGENV